MQLELTLHSHEVFWGEQITVLYKATSDSYQRGYDLLALSYPQVTFLPEHNFKQQVIEYVKRNKYPVFFCDDDVMIRECKDIDPGLLKANEDILAISMRMDPHYDFHWETSSKVEIPKFDNNTWEWQGGRRDWRFPMSVLGHIYRQADLLPIVEQQFYHNPNQLEIAMANNQIDRPLLYLFDQAKNINIPSNLVQDVVFNKSGEVSVEELNEKFLAGERIDLDHVIEKTKKSRSCFMLVNYKFVEVGK